MPPPGWPALVICMTSLLEVGVGAHGCHSFSPLLLAFVWIASCTYFNTYSLTRSMHCSHDWHLPAVSSYITEGGRFHTCSSGDSVRFRQLHFLCFVERSHWTLSSERYNVTPCPAVEWVVCLLDRESEGKYMLIIAQYPPFGCWIIFSKASVSLSDHKQ